MRDTARVGPDRARPPEQRNAPPGPSHGVLALQRVVGNRAVATALARRPTSKSSVLLGDLGTIPLESAQLGSREAKEVHLMSEQGDHSAGLARAAIDATTFEDADITVAGVHYVMKDAIISHYSVGGGATPMESWSLSYRTLTIVQGTRGPQPE